MQPFTDLHCLITYSISVYSTDIKSTVPSLVDNSTGNDIYQSSLHCFGVYNCVTVKEPIQFKKQIKPFFSKWTVNSTLTYRSTSGWIEFWILVWILSLISSNFSSIFSFIDLKSSQSYMLKLKNSLQGLTKALTFGLDSEDCIHSGKYSSAPQMLRLILSKGHGHKLFLKPSKPCHGGIH